jgi:hypothetical protein
MKTAISPSPCSTEAYASLPPPPHYFFGLGSDPSPPTPHKPISIVSLAGVHYQKKDRGRGCKRPKAAPAEQELQTVWTLK